MSLLLATRPGRRYIWGLLESCGIFRTSYSTDPNGMAFAEGRRDVGLRVLADVNAASPEQYLVMLRESQQEEVQ